MEKTANSKSGRERENELELKLIVRAEHIKHIKHILADLWQLTFCLCHTICHCGSIAIVTTDGFGYHLPLLDFVVAVFAVGLPLLLSSFNNDVPALLARAYNTQFVIHSLKYMWACNVNGLPLFFYHRNGVFQWWEYHRLTWSLHVLHTDFGQKHTENHADERSI